MPRLLLPILLLALTGCSRLELARGELLSKIDALLDVAEAKHWQANSSLDELASQVVHFTQSRISVQVRHTRLSEDFIAVQEKLSRTQEGTGRRSLQAEAESLRTARDRIGRVLGLLESREQQVRDRLQGLRLLLRRINDKQVALRAMRRAVEACEGIDFQSVEAEIKELEAAVDAELRFNEVRLDDLSVDWD